MAKEMKLDEKMADCIALSLRQQIACASTRIITPKTECLVQLTVDVQYQDISVRCLTLNPKKNIKKILNYL